MPKLSLKIPLKTQNYPILKIWFLHFLSHVSYPMNFYIHALDFVKERKRTLKQYCLTETFYSSMARINSWGMTIMLNWCFFYYWEHFVSHSHISSHKSHYLTCEFYHLVFSLNNNFFYVNRIYMSNNKYVESVKKILQDSSLFGVFKI